MLTITYCAALCACVACWRLWRRSVERISFGSFAHRSLVCSYWLLALTLLADLIASLNIQNDDLTHAQFTVLLLLAVGTMLQVALVAFVVTPVVMRGRFKTYSFTKAVIFMESCAVVSILVLALWLIWLMHDQRSLLHGP